MNWLDTYFTDYTPWTVHVDDVIDGRVRAFFKKNVQNILEWTPSDIEELGCMIMEIAQSSQTIEWIEKTKLKKKHL